MHASRQRTKAGALALAVFGIFALLAAFLPGTADAKGPPGDVGGGSGSDGGNGTETLHLNNGSSGDGWEKWYDEGDCAEDMDLLEPGQYLWHVIVNPLGATYVDLYVPGWGIEGESGNQAGGGAWHWYIVNNQDELPAGDFYVETDGSGGSPLVISHACHEPEDTTTTTTQPTTTTTVDDTTTTTEDDDTLADEDEIIIEGIEEEAPVEETTTTTEPTVVAGETLPRTGVESSMLAGIGILSLLGGLALMRASGRREELV